MQSHRELHHLCPLGGVQSTAWVRQPQALEGQAGARPGVGELGSACSPGLTGLTHSPGSGVMVLAQQGNQSLRPFLLKVKNYLLGKGGNVEACLWYFPPLNLPKGTKE